MNLEGVLAQLREERDALDAAISNLERLEHSQRRGPSRPRRFVTTSPTNGTNHRHQPPGPVPGES
jgi:hypothetical protein